MDCSVRTNIAVARVIVTVAKSSHAARVKLLL
jgi:hypothetical protein